MRHFYIVPIFILFLSLVTLNLSFAQPIWEKDVNNPVISGGIDWMTHVVVPCVLYNPDSERYEMWFCASSDGGHPYRIGFAVSDDGVTWAQHRTAVLEPDPRTWDESTIISARVIIENGQYKMWYTGWSRTDKAGIGYATSPDGINWTKDTQNNPVMPAGSADWEAGGQDWFCVLPDQGEGYKMWYTASNATYTETGIGYATSVDGIIWQRDILNNPILISETTSQWDEKIFNPHVIMLGDVYHMFYEGSQRSWDPRRMGWATSNDGINWIKYDNPLTTTVLYEESDPVLEPSPGQWDGRFIEPGAVRLEDDLVHLWYSGGMSAYTELWQIGHATIPLDSLQKYVVAGLEDEHIKNILSVYSLTQNYPNPFNPTTTINYELPITIDIDLSVYNLLGQKVVTLVSEKQNVGHHQVEWDASGYASGIYYYQLNAGDYQQVKKMVLLK